MAKSFAGVIRATGVMATTLGVPVELSDSMELKSRLLKVLLIKCSLPER